MYYYEDKNGSIGFNSAKLPEGVQEIKEEVYTKKKLDAKNNLLAKTDKILKNAMKNAEK